MEKELNIQPIDLSQLEQIKGGGDTYKGCFVANGKCSTEGGCAIVNGNCTFPPNPSTDLGEGEGNGDDNKTNP